MNNLWLLDVFSGPASLLCQPDLTLKYCATFAIAPAFALLQITQFFRHKPRLYRVEKCGNAERVRLVMEKA